MTYWVAVQLQTKKKSKLELLLEQAYRRGYNHGRFDGQISVWNKTEILTQKDLDIIDCVPMFFDIKKEPVK